MIETTHDPMGMAITDYWSTGHASRLRVFSPMFDEDEIPVEHLFRTLESMPPLERKALDMVRGRVLDVGAGAGCHTLVLQERGVPVTAIDISPLSVAVMKQRGVRNVQCIDFFELEGLYDTILMLMNGIGIVGKVDCLPAFFAHLDRVLAPGGQVLCDSSDISYVFENDDGVVELPPGDAYYGELTYRMKYNNVRGREFPWLFVDAVTLAREAAQKGYRVQLLAEGDNHDFLAKIEKIV